MRGTTLFIAVLAGCGDGTNGGNTDMRDAAAGDVGRCGVGKLECDGECIDPVYDLDHCGRCGNVCGDNSICDQSQCVCKAGFDDCGVGDAVVCVDLDTDRGHCGECRNACGLGRVCDGAGECRLACDPDETACGNACVDVKVSRDHCGACGTSCGVAGRCIASKCYCEGDLTVAAMTPSVHALSVPLDAAITLTMSCRLAEADLPTSPLAVFGERTGKASGTTTYDGLEVTFTPAEPFASGERVMVTVPRGVLDAPLDKKNAGWSGTFTVRTTAGFGHFEAGPTFDCTAVPLPGDNESYGCQRPTAGDFDHDGRDDIWVHSNISDFPEHGWVVVGDGEGGLVFGGKSRVFTDPEDAGTTVALDLDGDGWVDDVVDGGIVLIDTAGDLGFASLQVFAREFGSVRTPLHGDLDNDGDLDVVLVGSPARIYLNDGQGKLTPHDATIGATSETGQLGDVDHDGDLDYVADGVWLNDGRAYFTRSAVDIGFHVDSLVRDFDGDGLLDIFRPSGMSFGLGNGTFLASPFEASFPSDGFAGDCEALDIDGDGDLDIVLPIGQVLDNDGKGRFTVVQSLSSFNRYRDVKILDFDGDGAFDLVDVDPDRTILRVWLNRPAPAEE